MKPKREIEEGLEIIAWETSLQFPQLDMNHLMFLPNLEYGYANLNLEGTAGHQFVSVLV